jgi:hypothetical protein
MPSSSQDPSRHRARSGGAPRPCLRTRSDHVEGCEAAGVLRTAAVRRVALQRVVIDMKLVQAHGWTPEGYGTARGVPLPLVRLLWPCCDRGPLGGRRRLESLRRQQAFYEAVPASSQQTPWLMTLAWGEPCGSLLPAEGRALVQYLAPEGGGVVGLELFRDAVSVAQLP